MEIMNKWLVGIQGEEIVIGLPMRVARLSKEDALVLAAYLVVLASVNLEEDFLPILAELRNA